MILGDIGLFASYSHVKFWSILIWKSILQFNLFGTVNLHAQIN